MGLFESRASRNRKTFGRCFERLVDRVCRISVVDADDVTWNNAYVSWFWGASELAGGLVAHVESLRKLWGRGDDKRALSLMEVCIQPLISSEFENMDWNDRTFRGKEHSPSEMLEARRAAIWNVLTILGTRAEEKIRDYLSLDVQFSYESGLAEQGGFSLMYAELIMSKLREALGFEGFIDWEKQVFPIRQTSDTVYIHEENYGYGKLGLNAAEIVQILSLIAETVPLVHDFKAQLNRVP